AGLSIPQERAEPPSKILDARQAVVTPPPYEPMVLEPSQGETEARCNRFANAFLVTKNLIEAFEYISATYINHSPWAEDGPTAALDILGPVWPTTDLTVLRTTFQCNTGWLNYISGGMGGIVDRFRWESGCIVEHWDAGEMYPE
ncbi:hypothetical protein ACRALDRAFT_2096107, partial [Sodiomyces alcalophilus JCM 7366]|uniref:uncharacterized protein n=1 Tax=Sodiomyces alcalophilus JCM 7366 TaxID=591952 RepID=UPI0039B630D7